MHIKYLYSVKNGQNRLTLKDKTTVLRCEYFFTMYTGQTQSCYGFSTITVDYKRVCGAICWEQLKIVKLHIMLLRKTFTKQETSGFISESCDIRA